MPVIFLFVDGVGLGKEAESNPFWQFHYRGFNLMSGDQTFSVEADEINNQNHMFKHVDATLDVKGLPQSGTGQATLFSGENAPKEIGKHFGPYPHSGIKHLLRDKSLFKKALQLNKRIQFINAYPDIFFQKARERNRWSCTTLMTRSAEIKLNTAKEVKQGKALTAELTQEAWKKHLNINVPIIFPEEAAERLLEQTENYDLLLHEYYLTDKAGHSQNAEKANQSLSIYDRFLWQLVKHRSSDTTIVLSSDHGNIEDLSTKTHTLNDVPLFCYGRGARHFSEAKSIMDVTPGILKVLGDE